MIKNMLRRRKDSETYLATDSRHHRSPQIAMKVDKVWSFQPALRPSSVFLFSRHHRSPQIAMKVDKVWSFQPALRTSSVFLFS